MTLTRRMRQIMFLAGLGLVATSLLLDDVFATDPPPVQVPDPDTLALMGLGGAAMVVLSLIRKRRK